MNRDISNVIAHLAEHVKNSGEWDMIADVTSKNGINYTYFYNVVTEETACVSEKDGKFFVKIEQEAS
jgi:hypothetical protein